MLNLGCTVLSSYIARSCLLYPWLCLKEKIQEAEARTVWGYRVRPYLINPKTLKKKLLFMYVVMCVCACSHVWVHFSMWMCGQMPNVDIQVSCSTTMYFMFWGRASCLNPELTDWASLASQFSPKILSLPPQGWDYRQAYKLLRLSCIYMGAWDLNLGPYTLMVSICGTILQALFCLGKGCCFETMLVCLSLPQIHYVGQASPELRIFLP